jgi:sensor histidine kinase YesM
VDLAIELSNVLVETLLILYFLNCVYAPSAKKRGKAVVSFTGYGLILAVLSIFPVPTLVRGAYSLLAVIFLAWWVYGSRILNGLYASLALNIMAIFADVLCILLLKQYGISADSIEQGGAARVVSIVVAKIIVLIGIRLLTLLIRKNTSVFPSWTLPLIFGQILSIFAAIWMLHAALTSGTGEGFVLVFSGCLIYLNLVLCFYTETIKNSYENRRMRELAEQQLQMQIEYYEKEEQARESTRALWHDIKKYINTMQDMLESGNTPEAARCLEQVNAAFAAVHRTVDVGNAVVNGILERALEQTRNTPVSLELDVWVPAKLPIAAVDLNIIMGNTLDNAVEACLGPEPSAKQATVQLTLRQQNHMLFYEIRNPRQRSERHKPGTIHGYGLRNVAHCVEKYQGTMDVQKTEEEFSVCIQIPIN